MRKVIYVISLFALLFAFSMEVDASNRKKKKEKKNKEQVEELTPYQKLFKDKKVTTVKGLMTVHQVDKKVYVEFPLRLLEKDMLLASTIDKITDNGEGSVGEFVGGGFTLRFIRRDSVIQARMAVETDFLPVAPSNSSKDPAIEKALEQSSLPGVFGTYKIEAWTPDSSAVVIELTPLFTKHSIYTNPFPPYAPNAMFGFIGRRHKLQENRTHLKGIKAYDSNIVVKCEQGYDVDYLGFFGGYLAQDVKISVISNKILMLLPEEPMMPRLSDSRIGVNYVMGNDFTSPMKGLERVYYTSRWRIQPSDPEAYKRGELVEPTKPIVFYMDTIMPQAWKKYIKAGLEEWNGAFEKIGFKNVIEVRDFPKDDPDFDPLNIEYSVIRYVPVNWFMAMNHRVVDPRTGEILSMSICIPDNFIGGLYGERVLSTMNADPSVRRAKLTEEQLGEMIRLEMASTMGFNLGLIYNCAASAVYPVDSLRSASFTQKYGLSPSVMDIVPSNYIAQPGDVEKGVRMTNKGIGEYDEYAIKWLYKPIEGARTPQDEKVTLDRWIKESRNNPNCRYRLFEYYGAFDPSVFLSDLGDDQIKAFEYFLQNMKGALAHFYEWYKEDDRDMSKRAGIYEGLCSNLGGNQLVQLSSFIGGIRMIEANADEEVKKYEMLPKEEQRKMVHYLLNFSKDLSWLEDLDLIRQMGPGRGSMVDAMHSTVFGLLYSKMGRLKLCEATFANAYTSNELLKDIYQFVWEGTLKNRTLTKEEMKLQTSYLAMALKNSTLGESAATLKASGDRLFTTNRLAWNTSLKNEIRMKGNSPIHKNRFEMENPVREVGAYWLPWWIRVSDYPTSHEFYAMVLQVQDLLKKASVKSSGETRQHYDYLLYKIKKSLEKK